MNLWKKRVEPILVLPRGPGPVNAESKAIFHITSGIHQPSTTSPQSYGTTVMNAHAHVDITNRRARQRLLRSYKKRLRKFIKVCRIFVFWDIAQILLCSALFAWNLPSTDWYFLTPISLLIFSIRLAVLFISRHHEKQMAVLQRSKVVDASTTLGTLGVCRPLIGCFECLWMIIIILNNFNEDRIVRLSVASCSILLNSFAFLIALQWCNQTALKPLKVFVNNWIAELLYAQERSEEDEAIINAENGIVMAP